MELPIYTIIISDPLENRENMWRIAPYDVYKEFQQFGEIVDVYRRSRNASIELEIVGLSAEAENQLESTPIIINGHQYTADVYRNKPTYTLRRVDRTVPIAPVDQESPSQARYSRKPFDWNDMQKLDSNRFTVKLSLFVDCMRIFQPTNVELPFSYTKRQNITLRAIAEHCPNSTTLIIGNTNTKSETMVALQPLVPNLRKLVIPAKDIPVSLGNVDWQVEELHISFNRYCAMPRINIKSPKLEKLFLKGLNIHEIARLDRTRSDQMELILEFLARNVKINTLVFQFCKFDWAGLSMLAECVPNLEQLTFYNCSIRAGNRQVPGTFKCLTRFEISCCSDQERFMELLEEAPLRNFVLGPLDDLNPFDDPTEGIRPYAAPIDSICRLTTITSLCLHVYAFDWNFVGYDEVKRLMDSLSLQQLHIYETILTLADIKQILSVSNITKLDVGLRRDKGAAMTLEPAEMHEISAIIADRPELRLRVVCRENVTVIRTLDLGRIFSK